MDNWTEFKLRKKRLIRQCCIYKGEQLPQSWMTVRQKKCWQIEKEWVELLSSSFKNRDNIVQRAEGMVGNWGDFHRKVNMPKSLFAYFIIRSATSCFVHEWFYDVFDLISGIYSKLPAMNLFNLYHGQSVSQ